MSNSLLYYNLVSEILKDDYQKQAFLCEKNALVYAGPGSGKTSVLTLKATRVLNETIKPFGIACLTYSTEAANVMKERCNAYGIKEDNRFFIGTIHSFCLKEIIPLGETFNLNIPYPVKIASASERNSAFANAIQKVDGADNVRQEEMNRERRNQVGNLSDITIPSFEVALKVAKEYEALLRRKKLIDFEDIINYSVKLIQEQLYIKKYLESKYKWFFIDEYQDLGKPIHEMVLSLFINTAIKFFIVGDTNQSIYSFTGAHPEFMKELESFIGANSFEKVTLKNNYRSSKILVDTGMKLLDNSMTYNAVREIKDSSIEFITCEMGLSDQFNKIVDIIDNCDKQGIAREEIGILISQHNEINNCQQILKAHNIDCHISRRNFERTKYILWLEKCADYICGNVELDSEKLFTEWLSISNQTEVDISIVNFSSILFGSKSFTSLPIWIEYLENNLNLYKLKEEEKENYLRFREEILKDDYKEFTLNMFSKIGKPINQVALLTWFAAKGLEFDCVILTGMTEGIMPNFRVADNTPEMEEQWRLCFVGLTRAKKICYLMHSKYAQTRFGRLVENEPSRFWKKIKELNQS